MKTITAILSVYFLALVFFPCADAAGLHELTGDEVVMRADQDTPCGDHDHDQKDGCSPLCFCLCCHTSLLLPQMMFSNPLLEVPAAPGCFYTNFVSTSHINSLFRPPQA